jgi:hypothetical protein
MNNIIKTLVLTVSIMMPVSADAKELNPEDSARVLNGAANTSGIKVISVSEDGSRFVAVNSALVVYICSVKETRGKVHVRNYTNSYTA